MTPPCSSNATAPTIPPRRASSRRKSHPPSPAVGAAVVRPSAGGAPPPPSPPQSPPRCSSLSVGTAAPTRLAVPADRRHRCSAIVATPPSLQCCRQCPPSRAPSSLLLVSSEIVHRLLLFLCLLAWII